MKALTRMIRNLFGLSSDDSETESTSQESEITVEREPDTASEDAVKGTDTTGSGTTDKRANGEPDTDEETAASTPEDEPDTVDAAGEMSGSETESVDEAPDGAAESDNTEDQATLDSVTAETDEDDSEATATEAESDDTAEETATEAEADEAAEESDTETEENDATEETATDEPEETELAEPVDEISGIGPTYSERLGGVGIETVKALAESDPETVAEAAEVSESRAANWIDSAQNFA